MQACPGYHTCVAETWCCLPHRLQPGTTTTTQIPTRTTSHRHPLIMQCPPFWICWPARLLAPLLCCSPTPWTLRGHGWLMRQEVHLLTSTPTSVAYILSFLMPPRCLFSCAKNLQSHTYCRCRCSRTFASSACLRPRSPLATLHGCLHMMQKIGGGTCTDQSVCVSTGEGQEFVRSGILNIWSC